MIEELDEPREVVEEEFLNEEEAFLNEDEENLAVQ